MPNPQSDVTRQIPAEPGPRAGRILGDRYRLVGQIDAGGMGAVWEASDLLLGRRVAVKIPIAAAALDETERERVLGEARVAAQVVHPGVISIFDVGEQDGLPFVVMELVEGTSLARTLSQRTLSPGEALWIGADLADALESMHRQGVIHGDVKPANVILSAEGRPKLTDLGIASLIDDTSGDGRNGVGPPGYVAPEVMGGAATGSPTDTYALGVTLRELADAVDGGTGSTAGRERETAHSALEHTAERATADDPAERPTAGQIAAALGSVARVVEPTHRATAATNGAASRTAPIPGSDAATTTVIPTGVTTALPPATAVQHAEAASDGGGGRPVRSRRPVVAALVGLLLAAGLAGAIVAATARSNGVPAKPPSPSPSVTASHVRVSPSPSHPSPPAAPPPPAKGPGHGKDHKKHGGHHHGG
jgi:serine/threonine protein kinase